MHVGWVPDGHGGYRGQMAVLVKPNGMLRPAYMAAIKPFRYLMVYPAAAARHREARLGGGRRVSLPPGQRAVDGFPRFGTHMSYPPPRVLPDHEIAIGGAVAEPFSLPLAALADLPRLELTADFHCVAGWSATGLRWEGVPFTRFFAEVIEPALQPGRARSPT